ncbi:MAG: chromosome segregation protein SMC [Clostridia bacterium]|nr:chromosome segregation protein SMC [Clostridia bacterium]
MFLKRLEVYGFKSFAEKTELSFTNGITAIVGPNGSGKSNVGDAVRWVLGEQSAKQLRGGKMEDIIFNGTEKRRKLSFCEVTLVFDNQDRMLPIDYTEVAITRRLYRSGESEYCINRTPCRLKDVTELLLDTGIGKEGYSIIGQGKIDHILSNKAEERRSVFEEAAGIMKYKTRKLEAERRLERTCENIERLNDILSEINDRIDPLREQSETAQKYLAIREQLRSLEVNFYLYQYDMAAKRKEDINASLSSVEGEYFEKEQLRDKIREQDETSLEQMDALELELDSVRKAVLDLTARIEQGSGESRVFSERVAHLTEDAERLEKEIELDADMKATMLAAREGDLEAVDNKAGQIEQMKLDVDKEQSLLDDADKKLELEGVELEKMRTEIMNAMNRLSDVKVNKSRCEAIKSGLEQRLEQISRQEQDAKNMLDNVSQALLSQQESGKDIVDRHGQLVNKRDELRAELTKLQQQVRSGREDAQELAERLHAARQRASMLREMQNDYESFNNSVKHILKNSQAPSIKPYFMGVIAQLISVPQKYEKAVETALGSAMQNIVTKTEEDAKAFIEYLKNGKLGRATFLPMSAIRARRLENNEKNAIKQNGCYGIASDLVSFDDQYRNIFENLLGRTVICQSLDVCIKIARDTKHAFRLVTLDGDVINPGGSMTGGSSQSRLTSVLGRTRELEEAVAAEEELALKCEGYKGVLAQTVTARDKKEKELTDLERELHENEVLLAAENEKLNKLNSDADAIRETLMDLEQERSEHNDTLADIHAQLSGSDDKAGDIEQDNKKAQQELASKTAQYNSRKLDRERKAQHLTDMRVQLSAFIQELSAMKNNAERVEKELSDIDQRTSHKRAKLEDCYKQIEAINDESVNFGKQIDLLRQSLCTMQNKQQQLQGKKDGMNDEAKERNRRAQELDKDLLVAQEKKHKLELNLQKVDADIALMEQRIWDEYELTYLSATELRDAEFKVTGAQSEINHLRRDINALGTVNVNAIEEYVATKERQENLTSQLGDLQKAEQDLRKIISDMVKKMESRFAEQFAIINKYFGETFRKLFGGGKAELRLENSDDILGSGIDIVAQPPGKALQMLSLLSGGERALTAIAILFAMLRLKPTPFCILDEIEAALDEANVYNFAEYLRAFTDKTQFIVITHRKPTMEEADSLYGVAMEEKGVSSMVSVKLSDINND